MRSIHTTKQENHNKNNTPYRVIHKHRTKLGNPIRGIILPITSIITLSSILLAGTNVTYAEGSSVSLSVDNNDTVLELTVPTSVNLNLTPSSTNNYNPSGTASLSVSAGTNNITGYNLTMSVPNTNLTNSGITLTGDNNPNNIPLDNSNHPIIPTITSTYTNDSDFPDNTWGYRIGNTTYSPVSSNISLPGTNSAGNATTTTIELAAKVNSFQPAGTYTATLNFTAVANVFTYTLANFLADIDAAESGDTITMLGDVDGNSADLHIDKDIVIDAGGYSLSNFNLIDIRAGTYNNLVIGANTGVFILGGIYDHLSFSSDIDYGIIYLSAGYFTPTNTEGYLTMEEANRIAARIDNEAFLVSDDYFAIRVRVLEPPVD